MGNKEAIIEQIEKVINYLQTTQAENSGKYISKGLFPNWRMHVTGLYSRNDNSFFFSALIAQILIENLPFLPIHLKAKAESIIEKIKVAIPQYESQKGEKIFNFYPQKPFKPFGNGLFLKYLKQMHLANDSDDTVLAYSILRKPKLEHEYLQKKLASHANGVTKNMQNNLYGMEKQPAYSTWIGKKMPIELDVVVLANILKTQLEAGIILDQHGLASWEIIKQVILQSHYINTPFKVSPNYAKTEIIAYHISKLASYNLPDKELVMNQLQSDILNIIPKASSIQKLILGNTLNQLGVFELPSFEINPKDFETYSYFFAGFLSTKSGWIYDKLAPKSIFHFKWICPAHNYTLYLEHLCFKLKKASYF